MLAAASFGVAWSANKDFAPADEYFGRMKMSFLGINLTFKDQAAYANPHSTDPAIINKLSFAEDALQDWQRKYPKDAQLARSYFLAQQTYKKIWTKEYQDKAWDYMQLILKRYPNTFFSKTVHQDLAIGFTEHFYAAAYPCAQPGQTEVTPRPYATPGAKPGEHGTRKYDIIPVDCSTPAPIPTAAPAQLPASPAAPDVATPAATAAPGAPASPR